MRYLDAQRATGQTVHQDRADRRARTHGSDNAFGFVRAIGPNRRRPNPRPGEDQSVEIEPGLDAQLDIAVGTVGRKLGRRLVAQTTLGERGRRNHRGDPSGGERNRK